MINLVELGVILTIILTTVVIYFIRINSINRKYSNRVISESSKVFEWEFLKKGNN